MGNKATYWHEVLTERFSEDELRTLCFHLNVDYDELTGEGKGGKARELIMYLERRERLSELVESVQRSRPDVLFRDDALDLSSVRRRYLDAIVTAKRFSRWAGSGYIDGKSVLVHLNRPPSVIEGQADTIRYLDSQEALDLVDSARELIDKGERVLVLGELGMGKSTLLEKLVYVYANEALQAGDGAVLPVFVPLSRFLDDIWECIRAGVNEAGQLATYHFQG